MGKIATPIPMQEVVGHDLDVEAVLIYDQWGWPVFDNSYNDLQQRFKDKILIHDQVDSTKIFWSSNNSNIAGTYDGFQSVYQVFSLSKTLGLSGGGMANWNGKWLDVVLDQNHQQIKGSLDEVQKGHGTQNSLLSTFLKSDVSAMPADVVKWLKDNDLVRAYYKEKKDRLLNITAIIKSGLTKDWPVWFMSAVNEGNAPGIVPLFIDQGTNKLAQLQEELMQKLKIETMIYHFDFNGNPLMPDYRKCIALPIHGMINNLDTIVSTLLNIQK